MKDRRHQPLDRDLLKRVSRSFYLSLVLLPKPMREPLSLGYLLARASDTIADAGTLEAQARRDLLEGFRLTVREPSRGDGLETVRSQLRSQGVLEHDGERELIERLPECLEWLAEVSGEDLRNAIRDVLEVIIDGQSWDIERFELDRESGDEQVLRFCATAEELDTYTYRVAGCVGEFWTRVGFGSGVNFAPTDERMILEQAGRRYGQGLQLVNILRDVVDDLPAGRCYLPHDELLKAGWGDGDSWRSDGNRAALSAVAARWRETARNLLSAGDEYASRLHSRRVRVATRLPGRLGLRTLDLLDVAGGEAFDRRVKISRGVVWRELVGCALVPRR